MHLVGYFYGTHHDARSPENKEQKISNFNGHGTFRMCTF